jgi:hypothetical protein
VDGGGKADAADAASRAKDAAGHDAAEASDAAPAADAGHGGDARPEPSDAAVEDAASAASLISPDRITTWNPGILADPQAQLPLGADGLPMRTTVWATLAPGADIQAALDACPEGQVVRLGPGSFSIVSPLTLARGVVLRGSGSDGAPSGTTIVTTGGGTVSRSAPIAIRPAAAGPAIRSWPTPRRSRPRCWSVRLRPTSQRANWR